MKGSKRISWPVCHTVLIMTENNTRNAEDEERGAMVVERGNEKSVIVGREISQRRRKELKNSLVGFLKSDDFSPKDVEQWLIHSWKCSGSVHVRRLGQRKVLVSFKEGEDASRLHKEPSICSTSGPLAAAVNCAETLGMEEIWIRVSGIPLLAWDPETIEAVGMAVGEEVIEMDADSLSGEFSEIARLKLIWKVGEVRRNSIKLKVENCWYTLLVDWEEQSKGGEDSNWVDDMVRKVKKIIRVPFEEVEEKFRAVLRELEVKKIVGVLHTK